MICAAGEEISTDTADSEDNAHTASLPEVTLTFLATNTLLFVLCCGVRHNPRTTPQSREKGFRVLGRHNFFMVGESRENGILRILSYMGTPTSPPRVASPCLPVCACEYFR